MVVCLDTVLCLRQIDKERRTVVVESGVMVTDINETLANNGLALSV